MFAVIINVRLFSFLLRKLAKCFSTILFSTEHYLYHEFLPVAFLLSLVIYLQS